VNKLTVSIETWREMIDPDDGAPVTGHDAYLIVETPHENSLGSSKFGQLKSRCGAPWRDPHTAPVSCITFRKNFIGPAAPLARSAKAAVDSRHNLIRQR
jgi:hypothetical protein